MTDRTTATSHLPPPPVSRKARSTYDSLLESSYEIIRATGALSPEDVTERAAVSTATFYTYFSSKDHAVAAAFDLGLGRLLTQLDQQMTVEALLDTSLAVVVTEATHTVFDSFRRDARLYRLAISRLGESPMVRAVYGAREAQILDFLTAFCRRGIVAGRIRDADPRVLAKVFLVTMQGYQNPTLVRSSDEEVLAELTSMLVWELSPDRSS